MQSLCSHNELQELDHQQQATQQQLETEFRHISSQSLCSIHSQYQKVLQVLSDNHCSMANAFRLAGCPRSTIRDLMVIAELKIVDHQEHDRVIHDHAGSVKELEATCRTRLWRYLPVMTNLRREGKLLPLKFDERFYVWCRFSPNKTSSFRSHQVYKSQWPTIKNDLRQNKIKTWL